MSAEATPSDTRLKSSAGGIDLWQELPRLAVMVMELSWLVPWFQLITLAVKDQSSWFIGLIFMLVLFLSYVLARAAFRFSIRDNIRRRVFLAYIIGAVLLSIWVILYRQATPTDLWSLYNQSLDTMSDFRRGVIFGAARLFTGARLGWGEQCDKQHPNQHCSLFSFGDHGALSN
jgi:hypothetical protein